MRPGIALKVENAEIKAETEKLGQMIKEIGEKAKEQREEIRKLRNMSEGENYTDMTVLRNKGTNEKENSRSSSSV